MGFVWHSYGIRIRLLVTTQHTCAMCSSEQIQRNGHSSGPARYHCNGRGHQARFVPAAAGGRKKRSKRAGRCSDWVTCGRSWAAGGTTQGAGWPLNAPADASWLGCWAGAVRPRPAASGPPRPGATTKELENLKAAPIDKALLLGFTIITQL